MTGEQLHKFEVAESAYMWLVRDKERCELAHAVMIGVRSDQCLITCMSAVSEVKITSIT